MERSHDAKKHTSRVRFLILAIFGILLILIGLASLILSIIDLFKGRANVENYDESKGGLKIENPLWPSSGKGFWVGLVLIATGLVGVVSWREGNRSSIIGFAALSTLSACVSFYMVITCIIPVQYDTKYSIDPRPSWQSKELIINSLLIASGTLGSIIGAIAVIVSCIQANFCVNQRETYLYNYVTKNSVPGTPLSLRYPAAPVASPLGYSYSQPNSLLLM